MEDSVQDDASGDKKISGDSNSGQDSKEGGGDGNDKTEVRT